MVNANFLQVEILKDPNHYYCLSSSKDSIFLNKVTLNARFLKSVPIHSLHAVPPDIFSVLLVKQEHLMHPDKVLGVTFLYMVLHMCHMNAKVWRYNTTMPKNGLNILVL